jgi:hypothetical protein
MSRKGAKRWRNARAFHDDAWFLPLHGAGVAEEHTLLADMFAPMHGKTRGARAMSAKGLPRQLYLPDRLTSCNDAQRSVAKRTCSLHRQSDVTHSTLTRSSE